MFNLAFKKKTKKQKKKTNKKQKTRFFLQDGEWGWGWENQSHRMLWGCRGQTSSQEWKLQEGRCALRRERRFQPLNLLFTHRAGGRLLRRRAGWLAPARAKSGHLPEMSPREENEPDGGPRCPFPTLRCCDFGRPVHEEPRAQSKAIYARSCTFNMHIM